LIVMGRSSKPLLKGLLQKRWESSRVEQHRKTWCNSTI
jgi:hypothetical protein